MLGGPRRSIKQNQRSEQDLRYSEGSVGCGPSGGDVITDAPVSSIGELPLCAGYAISAGLKEQKAWECLISSARIMSVDIEWAIIGRPGKKDRISSSTA